MMDWNTVENHVRVAILVLLVVGVGLRLGIALRLKRLHHEFWAATTAETGQSRREDWLSVLRQSLEARPGPGSDWVVVAATRLLYGLVWAALLLLATQLAIAVR